MKIKENIVTFKNGLKITVNKAQLMCLNLISNIEELEETKTINGLDEILSFFFNNYLNIFYNTFCIEELDLSIFISIISINSLSINDIDDYTINADFNFNFSYINDYRCVREYNSMELRIKMTENNKTLLVSNELKFFIEQQKEDLNYYIIEYAGEELIDLIESNDLNESYPLYEMISFGDKSAYTFEEFELLNNIVKELI